MKVLIWYGPRLWDPTGNPEGPVLNRQYWKVDRTTFGSSLALVSTPARSICGREDEPSPRTEEKALKGVDEFGLRYDSFLTAESKGASLGVWRKDLWPLATARFYGGPWDRTKV
jgi:hypothetical protein